MTYIGLKLLKQICVFISLFILGTSLFRCWKRKANTNEASTMVLMVPIILFLLCVEV